MFSFLKIIKRFKKNQEGAAAVEFALVAIPFFVSLFAIIELALVFLIAQVLEEATNHASRYVLTGRAADGTTVVGGAGAANPLSEAQFKQKICDYIPALFSCSKVSVELKIYNTFNGANNTDQLYTNQNTLPGISGYTGTSGNTIAVVRAGYNYNVYVAKLLPWMIDNSQNGRNIMAVRSFRVEPY